MLISIILVLSIVFLIAVVVTSRRLCSFGRRGSRLAVGMIDANGLRLWR